MDQEDLHCPDGREGPSLASFTPGYFADYSQTVVVRTLELHGKATRFQILSFSQYLLQTVVDTVVRMMVRLNYTEVKSTGNTTQCSSTALLPLGNTEYAMRGPVST